MLTKYGPNNQHLIETKSQLDTVNSQIAEEIARINERARPGISVRTSKRKMASARLSAAGAGTPGPERERRKLQSLSQEAASSRQLYDALYGKLKELNIQAALRATNISVADPARPPSKPRAPILRSIPGSRPHRRVVLRGFVSVRSRTHGRHGNRCVAAPGRRGPPMLGNIPSSPVIRSLPSKYDSGEVLAESSPLINDPRSASAESFRSLRTAIQVASHAGRLRTLLVTSPLFGEGKSTVAYNTAVAFALAGKRVLLLDADMRKPTCTSSSIVPAPRG